ncbi:glycosyltransferase family 2 protein [Bacteroides acidifaciens]|uniref:glycosyltransferase family 2 protein n=1 Tax=Bacteroides acidifaciens TaxID=85831 RepID=UPI002557FF3A|nr:glycosyltransferase [Bacteroides acidifaciens]
MTNAQLTIIIPFLNEGEEIANTLSSIQDTATGMPTILLINDASTDGYNYRTAAEQYNCEYIQFISQRNIEFFFEKNHGTLS